MRIRAYDEATKALRMLVSAGWRECERTGYDSRRTGDWFSDRGSIPLSSIICGKEVALIMPSEEQKEAAIDRYVDLMRIKAYETGENKELDYQIKVAKVKLSSFGIDYSELEF